jgi:hypothetical protein
MSDFSWMRHDGNVGIGMEGEIVKRRKADQTGPSWKKTYQYSILCY